MKTADKNSYGWLIQNSTTSNKLLGLCFFVFVFFFLNSAKASKSAVIILTRGLEMRTQVLVTHLELHNC